MKQFDYIPQMQSGLVALGFFDGIHLGHQAVIKSAFDGAGTKIVLAVGNKGAYNSLILTGEETCTQLERLGTEVFLKPDFAGIKGMSGEAFVKDILHDRLDAKRVACGENFRFGAGASMDSHDMAVLCGKYGIECVVVPLVRQQGEIISATAIRQALSEGNVRRAEEMLGRRYGYSLPVVDGQHLGRSFGTPTINQSLPADRLLPRFGVYASITLVDGRWYDSVTNIGIKPTVGSESPVSETWIRDFSGDLYGKNIRVEIVGFIRPEKKFQSLDLLRSQILADGEAALEITGHISQKLNTDIDSSV